MRNATVARRETTLTRDRYGALAPGFATGLDFVFDTPKVDVRSLFCDTRGHGEPHRLD